MTFGPKPKDPQVRFWDKVKTVDSCWVWTASADSRGYGQFYLGPNKMVRAHRFAYESMVGPVQDGLELDHLCRVPLCVNPQHLDPVPHRVNMQRQPDNIWERRARQEACKRGHPLSGENVRVYRGRKRTCLTCKRDSGRESMRRRRAHEAR